MEVGLLSSAVILPHPPLFYVAVAPFVYRNPQTMVLDSVGFYLLISLLPDSPLQNKEKQTQKEQNG